ncbi:hypothetical protein GIB67_005441 [Kingdonia uniflora]|uniref:Methyltransferase-like protein 2 n=1 Tax=Kingdonia uniflora TaxID=39325 RepID=A0A7J7NH65_9MAGN|nr:hypothetical protein GIB67_005441 [Kingdonia uniflora]
MEINNTREFSSFMKSGIYRLNSDPTTTITFIDPVLVLNNSYNRFRVSPSNYYSRFLIKQQQQTPIPRKRKRKNKPPRALNQREQSADQRHQEGRPLLLKAHQSLLGSTDILSWIRNLKSDLSNANAMDLSSRVGNGVHKSLIELGNAWQAPLYDISLYLCRIQEGGSERKVVEMFNNMVINDTSDDAEARFLHNRYIIPKESCFHMSKMEQIHRLIPVTLFPAMPNEGFNVIVIDPPWENGSARQKSMYPTLANRHLLSIPIKQLTHTDGALVALWVTNREKLRMFIEKELFPMWGVSYTTLLYWLKVKPDGSLIGELDLFHHRPYECLLLGYSHREGVNCEPLQTFKDLRRNQVIISVPGDYSRKPPIGKLLSDYAPGLKPARCIELFARELLAGWTSWGNEPLHFQESKYFLRKSTNE